MKDSISLGLDCWRIWVTSIVWLCKKWQLFTG